MQTSLKPAYETLFHFANRRMKQKKLNLKKVNTKPLRVQINIKDMKKNNRSNTHNN